LAKKKKYKVDSRSENGIEYWVVKKGSLIVAYPFKTKKQAEKQKQIFENLNKEE
jgi:hypothetical protein